MSRVSLPTLSRRDWLRLSAAGVMGYSLSGWLETLAADAAANPQRKRACILLWMPGGPSQMDTFDLKPGHANGGPFREIKTSAPQLRISEHLPKIARFGDRLAVIRSMCTKEADHERASFLMRTGSPPTGPIQYPSLGALVAKELGDAQADLPNFVSIGPYSLREFGPGVYGPGFLGPQYAPLVIGETDPLTQKQDSNYEQAFKVRDIEPSGIINRAHAEARLDLLEHLESDFVARRPGVAALSHRSAYARAVRLMKTAANKAFNVKEEPSALRDAYGRNQFGQGCLLARRLVERGVPFVEVSLSEPTVNSRIWDTHGENFPIVRRLSGILDAAWSTLMEDLKQRGLLDSTLIVWMGEFGRTPKINGNKDGGRDHYAKAWSTVLAGGGIKGGQAFGKTSADGTTVETRPVSVSDFLATICLALGMDLRTENKSNVGRSIRIVDRNAQPIQEIVKS